MLLRLILVVALVVNTVAGQCRNQNDKYIGDLCYMISNQKMSFVDADIYCFNVNADLAVLRTTLQDNFLASAVHLQTSAPEGKFWIGLSRSSVNSRFTWDDGTDMYWSNFDPSFPKNNLYVAESTNNGKWQTLDGKQALYFVCSYTPGAEPTRVPMTTWYPASVPVSDSTGYPASVPPVSGPTGYPWSFPPNTDSTGYPASVTPVSGPTGAPWSWPPVSDHTDYPMSWPPVSGNPVSYPPVSDSTGWPASYGTGVPMTGYPGTVPPGGNTDYYDYST